MTETGPDRTATRTATASPPTRGTGADVGLLVLRLVSGAVLLTHGIQNAADPAGHIASTAEYGVPLAPLTGSLSLLGELGLSVLLLVGLLTRLAGGLTAVLMALTWAVSALPDGLITEEPGVNGEQAVLLAVVGVAFATLGGGRFALDPVVLPRLPAPMRRLG